MMLLLIFAASEVLSFGHFCESFVQYHPTLRTSVRRMQHCQTKGPFGSRKKRTSIGNIQQHSSAPNDRTEIALAFGIEEDVDDVHELRRRANELREEAHALELSLEESKLRKKNKKEANVQNWINVLFVNSIETDGDSLPQQQQQQQLYTLPTASTIARRIQQQKFSEDQLSILMQTLYQRRNTASLSHNSQQQEQQQQQQQQQQDVVIPNKSNGLVATNQTESDRMGNYMQLLLDALSILDQSDEHGDSGSIGNPLRWSGRLSSQLLSRLNDWSRMDQQNIRRRMDIQFLQARKEMDNNATTSSTAQDGTMLSNSSSIVVVGENLKFIPRWIPPSLLATVVLSKAARLDPLDIVAIKERVLTKTNFFCTSSDSFHNIAIFRGNMRPGVSSKNTNPISVSGGKTQNFSAFVFDEIQKIMEIEGLANRTQLFLLNDRDWLPNTDEREPQPKPVIVALPKGLMPFENSIVPSRRIKWIQEMSPIVAVCTTVIFSVGCYALNPIVFDGLVIRDDISVLSKCLPLIALIVGVHCVHEVAHQIMARKRGIVTGLPLLIPSAELGSFGCITKIRSFPPTRSALFDFAMSGPLTATVLSLSLMMVGCIKTVRASNPIIMTYPTVPLALFKSSFLTGSILTVMLPKVMMMPSSQPIPIHPFFVGGYTTLIPSALNLLPIFRLDGGRACTVIVGKRLSALTSAWTMLSLLSIGMSGSGLAWTWGAFILFFQRQPEITPRDDVTPVGKVRTTVWVASLALSLLILLPFPGGTFL